MPYIKIEQRRPLDDINEFLHIQTTGELNYCITLLLQNYLVEKGESYQTYNDCLGALEGAKQELYRRKIAKYEDNKIKENGDVYK